MNLYTINRQYRWYTRFVAGILKITKTNDERANKLN